MTNQPVHALDPLRAHRLRLDPRVLAAKTLHLEHEVQRPGRRLDANDEIGQVFPRDRPVAIGDLELQPLPSALGSTEGALDGKITHSSIGDFEAETGRRRASLTIFASDVLT
jgi:hypothetical protein